jgi:EAL domain-containing protein (putative c-di-GMP-specific phosphodiesterase class I)
VLESSHHPFWENAATNIDTGTPPDFDHVFCLAPCIAAQLSRALTRGELVALFQPKIDLRTMTLGGAEALVRWNRNGHGLISAGLFIDEFRRYGLLHRLTDVMIDRACAFINDVQRRGGLVNVSINAEWSCIESRRLLASLLSACNRFGVEPADLQIELMETSTMVDKAAALSAVKDLRSAGFSVAIDDFGIGNSSLQLLRELECDVVKLDRSLVQGVSANPRAAALLYALVRFAVSFGVEVVAEGVESPEDAKCLTQLGCHKAQGYLYARPMSGAEFVRNYF